MGKTFGIHWAATTHGTWLHGDVRGSWRNGQLIGPDPFLEAAARARMSRGAVLLDSCERAIVARAFGVAVREWGYEVLVATIQPTHFHLIFAPHSDSMETIVARLKYRSSAAVLKHRSECGFETPRSLWTGGMFPVFMFSESHLSNAIEYVHRHNRRDELPNDPYDWIRAAIPNGDRSAI